MTIGNLVLINPQDLSARGIVNIAPNYNEAFASLPLLTLSQVMANI